MLLLTVLIPRIKQLQVSQFNFEMQRPKTAAQVLDDCEDLIDAEVAHLIRRNEKELRELRQSIKMTKREMDDVQAGEIQHHPGASEDKLSMVCSINN